MTAPSTETTSTSSTIASTQRLRTWAVGSLVLLGVALGSLLLVWPMIQQSYPNHPFHSFQPRVGAFQYQRQFFSGQFYPRWLEFSNFGFGNATFAFYPPLCMVAMLPFRALGLAGSLVGSMALAIGMLGLGMYGYARCLFARWIAVGVAAMGMTAPYFLVDIFQRGAIGEVWAIVTIPWILWMTQQVVQGSPSSARTPWPRTPWPMLRLALAYGMLVLSHLPTLLIFTLVWIPMPWLTATTHRWQATRRAYTGALLAFGWTGFFLWPAALDQRFVQVASVNAIDEYVPHQRLMVSGLWRLRPVLTGHWFEKGLLGSWGYSVAVLALISGGLGLLLWQKSKRIATQSPPVREIPDPQPGIPWLATLGRPLAGLDQRLGSLSSAERITLYWLGAGWLAVLMMTDLLGWIYPWVTPLQRIQFSWRWMAITAVLVPLVLGSLLHQAQTWAHAPQPSHLRYGGAALGILAFGLGGFGLWQGINVLEKAVYQPTTIQQFSQMADQKNLSRRAATATGHPVSLLALDHAGWSGPGGCAGISGARGDVSHAAGGSGSLAALARWPRGGSRDRPMAVWTPPI
ncbi:MAG: hypothetical protein HC818_04135 [Synechococcaceae cyanobacterium RM1_1_27]|nr:hypothetical protein [Synechococcaceae cyanobacterium RM1_1_27]